MPKQSSKAPPRRFVRDGLGNDSMVSYPNIAPKTAEWNRKLQLPVQSRNTKVDSVITFEITSGTQELIRFTPQSVLMKYTGQLTTNDAYTQAKEDALKNDALNDALNIPGAYKQPYWRSLVNTPQYYIDPRNPLASFFSKIEILLDNQIVSSLTEVDLFLGFYTQANRAFADARDRKWLLNHTNEVFDKDDVKSGNAKIYSNTDFGNYATPDAKLIRGSLDGLPIFSLPRNYNLAKLLKRPNKRTLDFLPPQTKVTIRLFRHTNPLSYFFDGSLTDAAYFTSTKSTDTKYLDGTKNTLNLESIYVEYESLTFAPIGSKLSPIPRFNHFSFHYDAPKMTYYTLNSGHAMTRKDVRIHRGTKLVYFALCYSHQLWFNPGSNKTCTNKVIIPKELKNMRILIDRKDAIIEGGLRELVGTTAEQSPWARMYYSYLTERGFTDKEYEQWFPGDSKIPYDWFIPVDFSSYDMHTDKIIDVMCEWGDDSTAQKFCPDNMNLVVVEVRQVKVYRERENTPWMSKVVV